MRSITINLMCRCIEYLWRLTVGVSETGIVWLDERVKKLLTLCPSINFCILNFINILPTQNVAVLVAKLYPTFCDSMGCSRGVVGISFSKGSFWPRDWTWVSCIAEGQGTGWSSVCNSWDISVTQILLGRAWKQGIFGFWVFALMESWSKNRKHLRQRV